MSTTRVDPTLVHHEVAHIIHAARHRGDAAYCASDAAIADQVTEFFRQKGWRVIRDDVTQP
jgi:hypothetical protein